jgi:hypothetical protein
MHGSVPVLASPKINTVIRRLQKIATVSIKPFTANIHKLDRRPRRFSPSPVGIVPALTATFTTIAFDDRSLQQFACTIPSSPAQLRTVV